MCLAQYNPLYIKYFEQRSTKYYVYIIKRAVVLTFVGFQAVTYVNHCYFAR